MAWRHPGDEGVTSPLGTALTIGIVVLMAIGLIFMVRIFLDRGDDPQELATFRADEVEDSLQVQHAEADVSRADFEVRMSVAGDFDVSPLASGPHALDAGEFAPMGGAAGGPPDGSMQVGTVFRFCAAGGQADDVSIELRHVDSNSLTWRGGFATLAACP